MKKKTTISAAVTTALALTVSSAIAAPVIITLTGNATPATFNTSILPVNNATFTSGNTFRLMTGGAAAGFGEKNTVNGTETWTFDAGIMTAVANTELVPAVSINSPSGNAVLTAGAGLFQNADLFGTAYGMLAPIVGSDAANATGAGSIQNITGDNFEILFPVLHTHWLGIDNASTLGEVEGGIVFSCTGWISGSAGGHCSADSLVNPSEDAAGFAGWYTQRDFDIEVTAVPVPAAAWLFGSGLLAIVGIARRKKVSS